MGSLSEKVGMSLQNLNKILGFMESHWRKRIIVCRDENIVILISSNCIVGRHRDLFLSLGLKSTVSCSYTLQHFT